MSQLRFATAAVLTLVLMLQGCVGIAPIHPYERGYVLVDSQPVLKNYCDLKFTKVRVTQVGSMERGAFWEAVAIDPQESLPILAEVVPGYEVSAGGDLDTSSPLLIDYAEEGGTFGSFAVNLRDVGDDQVGFSGGIEARAEFLRHWRSDFGCPSF